MPLFPLNVVLFPGMRLPLHIFEDRYKLMISRCLETDHLFGVLLIRSGPEVGGQAVPYSLGTLARIQEVAPLSDGRMNLLAEGEQRFELAGPVKHEPYPQAQVRRIPSGNTSADPSLVDRVAARLKEYVAALRSLTGALDASGQEIELRITQDDADRFSFQVSAVLQIDPTERQRLLEMNSSEDRLRALARLLRRECDLLRLMASGKGGDNSIGAFSRN